MRTSIAYFAGAGTVVAAIAAGLGGGLLMANIMNPHAREASKLEQRHASPQQAQQSPQPNAQPSALSTAAASNEPQAPAPYLAATQQAATRPVVVAPAPSSSPQPSSEASNAAPQAAPPTQAKQPKEPPKETAASNQPSARSVPSTKWAEKEADAQASKPQEQAATQPDAREQGSAPDNAYARARDADVKRQAAEQRKAERRQQRAARRQQRDQGMRDVEQNVREDSDSREVIMQRDDSDRPRFFDSDRPRRYDDSDRSRNFGESIGFPHINLFGPD